MFPSLCGHCRRMTGKQETIRTRRRLLGDWSFHSDPADFQRMPVEDATPNEFCFKLALMGRPRHTIFFNAGDSPQGRCRLVEWNPCHLERMALARVRGQECPRHTICESSENAITNCFLSASNSHIK